MYYIFLKTFVTSSIQVDVPDVQITRHSLFKIDNALEMKLWIVLVSY